VERLTPLPSDVNPLLVFLGVNEGGDEAVFLVDTDKLKVGSRAEGECKPTPANCSLLSLRDDPKMDEHTFVDEDGDEYYIKLENIELTRIAADTRGSKAKGARARGVKAAVARRERASRVAAAKERREDSERSERGREFAFHDFFVLFRYGR